MSDGDFRITMERLESLAVPEIENDPDVPSVDTLRAARSILNELHDRLSDFPRAAPSGFEGSVDVYWSNNDRRVQLSVSGKAGNPSFVYWRHGEGSHLERDASLEYLVERLQWLRAAQ